MHKANHPPRQHHRRRGFKSHELNKDVQDSKHNDQVPKQMDYEEAKEQTWRDVGHIDVDTI